MIDVKDRRLQRGNNIQKSTSHTNNDSQTSILYVDCHRKIVYSRKILIQNVEFYPAPDTQLTMDSNPGRSKKRYTHSFTH